MKEIKTTKEFNNLLKNIDCANHIELYEIALIYDYGYEIENCIIQIDKQKAFDLYNKSYLKGNIDATIRMADFHSEGEMCEKNIDLAITLYMKYSDKNATASHNLSTIYRDLELYEKAFKQHLITKNIEKTPSMELAYCYHYGIGTESNKKKALQIFKEIAEKENTNEYEIEDANYNIGLYYLDGIVVEKSIVKARNYLNKANKDNDNRNANEILLVIGR